MTDVNFSGKWRNQRGSTMELTQDINTGKLKGNYTTLVGADGNQSITKSIEGQAHGDQIVFYVDWWPYSMTTWAGQLLTQRDGGQLLETVWINTKDVSDDAEPDNGWAGLRTGGDTFTQVK